jgi:hypothetical protein
MKEARNTCIILVEKPLGKWPLTRAIRMWENNFKIGLREIVCENMNWLSNG